MSGLVFERDNLPKGWVKTNLENICLKIHYGYTVKSTKEEIGPKYLRITDIQNNHVNWNDVPYCSISSEKSSNFLLKPNDLVFARTGATVGKSFLIKNPPKSIFASYLIRIILSKKTHANYVNYFFKSKSYWDQIHLGSVGMAQPNFNASKLSKIFIPLPPLNEQKRIVTKIESIFAQIDAGKEKLVRVKGLLKQNKQSVLKSAFGGRLVPQNPNDESAEVLLKKIHSDSKKLEFDKDNLPKGWINVTLDQIIEPSKEKFEPRNSDNRMFLGLEHIESNSGIILGKGNSINTKSTKTIFNKGDVLYGKLRPYLNKVCVPVFDGVCSTDILVFSKNPYRSSKYIAYFLSQSKFVRFANRNSTGVQHPRIKFDVMSKFYIQLPPLPEQKRIIQKIESIFGRINAKFMKVNMTKLIHNYLII